MFKLFKDIIFGFRLKRAIKKADKFRHITHRKYMVIVIKGKFEVLSKQLGPNYETFFSGEGRYFEQTQAASSL